MKLFAIALAAVFMGLLLQKALSQTNLPSATASPSPITILTNQYLQPAQAVTILSEAAQPAQPLKPGIYQTHPYAITLIVPKPVKDDCKIIEPPNIDPRMPLLRPKIEIVPESSAEK